MYVVRPSGGIFALLCSAVVAEGDIFNSRWQRHRYAVAKYFEPEGVEEPGRCDPYRVGTIGDVQPVALPPAIEFVAFGDSSDHESMRGDASAHSR